MSPAASAAATATVVRHMGISVSFDVAVDVVGSPMAAESER
jgi:hypothetical protein